MLHKRTNQESGDSNGRPMGKGCQWGLQEGDLRDGNLGKGEREASAIVRVHKASDQRRTVPLLSGPILPLCQLVGVGVSDQE